MTFLECWRIAHGISNAGQTFADGMRELLKDGSPLRVSVPVLVAYDAGLDDFDYQQYF